jgi:hypothetical protein
MSDVFTLSVRLERAAFIDAQTELAAIVRSVADTVADVGSLPSLNGAETKVFDANGNSCGTWSVQPARHDVRRWLAAALGHDHGAAERLWVIGGNSTFEQCANIIRAGLWRR